MTVKDITELLEILHEILNENLTLRSICDDNAQEETSLKDYYINTAAKAGIRASRLGYFIRMIEETQVFKWG